MIDTALPLVQAAATGLIAAWLTLGVRDNILYPAVNETYTAEVMAMTRMRIEYPAEFAEVAHRAVTDRRIQQAAFRTVVVAELLACVLLWAGSLALLLVFFSEVSQDMARGLALVGALAFTTVWAGFLIVGNHFCYWFCHDGAQNTHYQMTLWGAGTMILIAIG